VTDAEGKKDSKKILINLNLAKKLDNGSSEIKYRIEIIKFIIIEILKDKAYIYRYNLELFFYVFL
jgi:hypothetical protein